MIIYIILIPILYIIYHLSSNLNITNVIIKRYSLKLKNLQSIFLLDHTFNIQQSKIFS